MFEIVEERPEDGLEVEALYDTAFAPGRTALSSYRLRDGVDPIPGLSLLIRDSGAVAAAIRNWPVLVGGTPCILLGPVAVHPTRQGEGLGSLLMAEVISRATKLGWTRILLVGDAPYYSRFGFSRIEGVHMPPPTNPDRVLARELVPGAWQGVGGNVTRYV